MIASLPRLPVLVLCLLAGFAHAGNWVYSGTQYSPVPPEIAVPLHEDVTAVAVGGMHMVALKQGGSVVAWGASGPMVPATAQSGVTAITAGRNHTVALKQDGNIVAWGYYQQGQVTVPAAAQSGVTAIAAGYNHTAVLKQDGRVVAWNAFSQIGIPAAAQSGVIAIAAGNDHTVALKQDGSVVAWGGNQFGQTTVPEVAQSEVIAIAAGGGHTVALKQGGNVVAWGRLNSVPVAAQSGVIAIAAGGDHAAALKQDGGVVGWGSLGGVNQSVPNAAKSGVIAIAAGHYHVVALKQDGSVVAWGWNTAGQTVVPAAAVQSGVTAIAAGGSVAFYRLADPPEETPFTTWAENAGLQDDDALPDAIPFHDGVPNLLKYAFNLDGSGPDVSRLVPGTGVSGLPWFGPKESESGPVFRLEYLRRINAGLDYTPMVSADLSPGSFMPMTGTETITFIDTEWERVSVERPIDPENEPRLFGMVEVEFSGE